MAGFPAPRSRVNFPATGVAALILLRAPAQSQNVVINEIHYDDDDATVHSEFVELQNPGTEDVDLAGCYFSEGIALTFPAGAVLAPGGYVIVCEDAATLSSKWGLSGSNVFSWNAGAAKPIFRQLKNTGETITLRSPSGGVMDEVRYGRGFPWPTVGDPPNYSIELIHPSLDNDLGGSWRRSDGAGGPLPTAKGPTPGKANSVFSATAPPTIRQVDHTPVVPGPLLEWVPSAKPVRISAKITDPDGVTAAAVAWQIVEPGDYLKQTDPRYDASTSWTTLPMTDDGLNGDLRAGDAVYSALIPAEAQKHRRLIRYRISATDSKQASVHVPYADDPQGNFAYFVYDALPAWSGKAKSGQPVVTYPPSLLGTVPAYHLITRVEEHANAQYVPVIQDDGITTRKPAAGAYSHSNYIWQGALCYAGKVYDHIHFRARGGVWRFAMGKNMWKFDFNRGHEFEARDNYGRKYDQPWKKLNFSSCIQQGDFNFRGEQGLFESVGFRLFQLTGLPAENTSFAHFRIIERPSETNGTENQYDDDFQGIYLSIEQMDGQFLDQHGLPDGNLYKMEGGSGELNNTGPLGPKNKTDLTAFQRYTATEAWWRENCDLPNYYNYRAIVDSIHHYDIADGKNYYYYRNPLSSKWTMLPWDLDLTWDDNMYRSDTGIQGLGNGTEPFFSRVFGSTQSGNGPLPALRLEMRNRVREVQDLLFTREQTGMLIDEMASFIYQPGQPSFVDADRAMWDNNPIMVSTYVNSEKSGWNRFYASAANDPATPESESGKFAGMMVRMKNYINSRRSVIASRLLTSADEDLVPATPVFSRSGEGPVPTSALSFSSSAFAGKNGATFAGLKWRIAEFTDPSAPGFAAFDHTLPRVYEIENAWESGILASIPENLTAPATAARPGRTYRARAKHLDSTGRWSHWSAPVAFTASEPDVTAYQQSLVISQIYYHPAAPGASESAVASDPEAYEWIEVMNVGPAVLDLTPVRFTKGINFDFAGSTVTSLPPGQRVLVVRNIAAFTARYGTSPGGTLVAGEWQAGDALSNSGEQVKLSFGAGTAIQDFAYHDKAPWPDGADGSGFGLVLRRPGSLPDHNLSANWRLSVETGGKPGQSDRITYADWAKAHSEAAPMEDPDHDGLPNLAEYALGTDPGSSLAPESPVLTPGVESGSGFSFATVALTLRTGADDAVVSLQFSSDLKNWVSPPAPFERISTTGRPDGRSVELFRSLTPQPQLPKGWFRLKVSMEH